MTATSTEILALDFSAMENKAPAKPVAGESELDRVAESGDLRTYSVRAQLTPDQLTQVERISSNYIVKLRTNGDDRIELGDIGSDVMNTVRRSVDSILQEQGKVQMPEVRQMLGQMEEVVSGFRRKYDPSSPQTIELIENIKGIMSNVITAFRIGRNSLERLYHDSQDASVRLDRIAAKLVVARKQLKRNVISCKQLEDDNRDLVPKLIQYSAVFEQMEIDLDALAAQLNEQVNALSPQSLERPALENQLEEVLELKGDVQIRLNEFIQQLFLTYASIKQIRKIGRVSNGLAERLRLLLDMTIPTMKRTIAAWGYMVQAETYADGVTAIDDANDSSLRLFAAAAEVSVVKAEQVIQRPSTRPETMFAIADSLISQNRGMLEAFRVGAQQRAEVVDAFVRTTEAVAASDRETREQLIGQLAATAVQPLPALEAPDVPDFILEDNQAA